MPRDHKKLKVFAIADDIVIKVYRLTRSFPNDERFGLTSQVRRAAVSVPTNIVEGSARESEREYLHFLNIALGSLAELTYLLDLSHRLDLIDVETYSPIASQCQEAGKKLNRLIQSLKASNRQRSQGPFAR